MRRILFQISVLLTFTVFGAHAQEVISADVRKGCDELTVQFTLENAYDIDIYSSIEWNFGDGDSAKDSLSVEHTYTSPGIFSVSCLLDGGRGIKRDTFITVSETPYADFKYKLEAASDDEFTYLFEPLYFKPIDGIDLNYTWRFRVDEDSIDINEKSPVYAIPKDSICHVILWLTDEIGCVGSSDTVLVRSSRSLWIPNVFSPNDDTKNDYFKVTTSGDGNWIFNVFTRDGMLVFSSNSPQIIWNGRTYGDQQAPASIYYYTIMNEIDLNEKYSGFIYLYR